MDGGKAEKAEQELAWRDSRIFARSLESWLKGEGAGIQYQKGGETANFFSLLGRREKEWLRDSYSTAKKEERALFLKTLIYFMYWLGVRKTGCENLATMFRWMAGDGARLGEMYDYLVQYGDERIEHRGLRFSSMVSVLRKQTAIEQEYHRWFAEEFQVPPEGIWTDYPSFFSTKTPKEFAEMRKAVKWGALYNILSSPYGLYVGSAALGKIESYVKGGGLTKLTFPDRKRAARVASLLFEFGLQDISQNSNRITLGLKETIYEARKKVVSVPSIPAAEKVMDIYLDYFRGHGLGEEQAEEIGGLFSTGRDLEAVDRMCKLVLQECKRQYLLMGEKKYSFGEEGKKMISDFKKRVGEEGEASLLSLSDMLRSGEYSAALERLRAIMEAIEKVRGDYPQMFSS
jgi:hypothetical protein